MKIRDQIAMATGGAEGRGSGKGQAPSEAARAERQQPARPEAPARDVRPQPPKGPAGKSVDGNEAKRREGERIPSPFPPEPDRRGQRPRAFGPQQNRRAEQERYPSGRDQSERKEISDEEAARRAANDPRQPGIIPFAGPAPRPQPQQNDRPGQRHPFGRKGGRRS